jgi:hypothetical protein
MITTNPEEIMKRTQPAPTESAKITIDSPQVQETPKVIPATPIASEQTKTQNPSEEFRLTAQNFGQQPPQQPKL